mmetsp:Transcript_49289/g.154625  ORF Transcript_49289/g.154625 Transcript_49289/m.154625 type:complete len:286 (-) Transcript_49289:459-1316(-)
MRCEHLRKASISMDVLCLCHLYQMGALDHRDRQEEGPFDPCLACRLEDPDRTLDQPELHRVRPGKDLQSKDQGHPVRSLCRLEGHDHDHLSSHLEDGDHPFGASRRIDRREEVLAPLVHTHDRHNLSCHHPFVPPCRPSEAHGDRDHPFLEGSPCREDSRHGLACRMVCPSRDRHCDHRLVRNDRRRGLRICLALYESLLYGHPSLLEDNDPSAVRPEDLYRQASAFPCPCHHADNSRGEAHVRPCVEGIEDDPFSHDPGQSLSCHPWVFYLSSGPNLELSQSQL